MLGAGRCERGEPLAVPGAGAAAARRGCRVRPCRAWLGGGWPGSVYELGFIHTACTCSTSEVDGGRNTPAFPPAGVFFLSPLSSAGAPRGCSYRRLPRSLPAGLLPAGVSRIRKYGLRGKSLIGIKRSIQFGAFVCFLPAP